jgi:hypothetical protein
MITMFPSSHDQLDYRIEMFHHFKVWHILSLGGGILSDLIFQNVISNWCHS